MTERHNHEQSMPSVPTPGDGKALSERAKRLVRLITGTHRGDIDTHRELYELIDSMAIAIDSPPLTPAPSVPDGWRHGVEAVAAMIQKKADDYANEHGYDDLGGLSFGWGPHAEVNMDHHTGLLELADEVRAMVASPPKPTPWNPSPEDLAAIRAAQERRAVVTEMPGGGIAFLNYGEADADYAHLDCPACGGSGHVGDTRAGAFRDVLAERRRQIEAEGWTPAHDDRHGAHELAEAAACYCLSSVGHTFDFFTMIWPWEQHWFKSSGPRRDLVKAGALILAEIERLDRAAP